MSIALHEGQGFGSARDDTVVRRCRGWATWFAVVIWLVAGVSVGEVLPGAAKKRVGAEKVDLVPASRARMLAVTPVVQDGDEVRFLVELPWASEHARRWEAFLDNRSTRLGGGELGGGSAVKELSAIARGRGRKVGVVVVYDSEGRSTMTDSAAVETASPARENPLLRILPPLVAPVVGALLTSIGVLIRSVIDNRREANKRRRDAVASVVSVVQQFAFMLDHGIKGFALPEFISSPGSSIESRKLL